VERYPWNCLSKQCIEHSQSSASPRKRSDNFPPPVRYPVRQSVLGKKIATIMAGRGCVFDCSFCSIREFYSKPPGPAKRVRRPEMVAREIELLYNEMGCSIFMFQDDDFPVAKKTGSEWTNGL